MTNFLIRAILISVVPTAPKDALKLAALAIWENKVHGGFDAHLTDAASAEQETATLLGGETWDDPPKLLAFIPIDQSDPALRAFVAIWQLTRIDDRFPLQALIDEIFLAGQKSVSQ